MKIFSKVTEIRAKNGDLHFQRFAILETAIFSIYIHRILIHDKDLHLHSHPWRYFTWILKGAYVEEMENGILRTKGFLAFSKGGREGFHKIHSIVAGPVYTFFVSYGKKIEPCYYLVNGKKIDFPTYRKLKHDGKLPVAPKGYDEN